MKRKPKVITIARENVIVVPDLDRPTARRENNVAPIKGEQPIKQRPITAKAARRKCVRPDELLKRLAHHYYTLYCDAEHAAQVKAFRKAGAFQLTKETENEFLNSDGDFREGVIVDSAGEWILPTGVPEPAYSWSAAELQTYGLTYLFEGTFSGSHHRPFEGATFEGTRKLLDDGDLATLAREFGLLAENEYTL